MIEIKEVLRLWLAGQSLREVTRLAGVDRKTVRRYVQAAQAAGVARDDGDDQLTDEVLGAVVAVVRPDRPRGTGASWEAIAGQREQIKTWLAQDLTVAKIHVLLGRRGVTVPYRTLHRYTVAELGFGRPKTTVRVAATLGFRVWVVSDATATFDRRDLDGRAWQAEEVHALSLANMSGDYAVVVETESLLVGG